MLKVQKYHHNMFKKDNQKAESCRLFAASEPKLCIFKLINFKLIIDLKKTTNKEKTLNN